MAGATHFVMILANDLYYDGIEVVLGSGTKRALEKGVRVYRKLRDSGEDVKLIVTAGWSEAYQVRMRTLMVEYLLIWGAVIGNVVSTDAREFNTNGELAAFCDVLSKDTGGRDFVLHLVTRWHHLPRTWVLMRARLRERRIDARVKLHACRSFRLYMLIYEALAFVKNIPNVRGAFI